MFNGMSNRLDSWRNRLLSIWTEKVRAGERTRFLAKNVKTKRILKESLTLKTWSGMMNRSLKSYTGLQNLSCFNLTLRLIQRYTKLIKSLGQKEEWLVMHPSFLSEVRFTTTATFDDESVVDSSHLLLPTWPCPRWLFQFTVNSMKLRFYTEKTIIIQGSSVNSKI